MNTNMKNPAVLGGVGDGMGNAVRSGNPSTFQNHETAVLDALQRGRAITQRDALHDFGTSRLAAVIHRLREQGWPIKTDSIPVACRAGRVTRVARYRMDGGAANGRT